MPFFFRFSKVQDPLSHCVSGDGAPSETKETNERKEEKKKILEQRICERIKSCYFC